VSTAADIAALDHRRARELLTVAGERIVFELRGKSCIAFELRRHGLGTDFVTVFFHTSPFGTDPQHSAQRSIALLEATNDTLELVRASQAAVRAAWREGYRYSKAGVFTTDLVPIAKSQRALFGRIRERSERLMHALDSINTRYGRGTLFPAANGIRRSWDTRFDMRSPRFTTCIDELPVVAAK
jgi:DNA polymerase V